MAQPIVTVHNDTFVAAFTIQLNGKNYSTWSKMMLVHVSGQGIRGYLTRKVVQVEEDASCFDSWCIEDSIVKGWLIKTTEPDLVELFLDLPIANDVWESTTQMDYDASDKSQIWCKATCITQGGRDIASYFVELKSVWLELDRRRPINMKCLDDVKFQQAEIHKDRIYDFLAGLDDEFDKIRGDLLRLSPLLKLEESFAF
ncbi:hypothetical protein CerSpe_165410 [Prunus speciosa]